MNMRAAIRLCLAVLLGVGLALLVTSCGGSGKGLIPAAQAGPLRGDFEAVAQAAQSAGGRCEGTERALGKTEKDFLALPAGVNGGLRGKLREGISNLRQRAMAMCEQPPTTATTGTTATPTVTTTQTTAPTATTPASTTPATPPSSGGTPAGEGEQHSEGEAQGPPGQEGHEKGPGNGVGNEGPDKGEGKGGAEGAGHGAEPNSGGASAGGPGPGVGR